MITYSHKLRTISDVSFHDSIAHHTPTKSIYQSTKSKMRDAQAPIIDFTGNTKSIEDSHIATGTRDTYKQQIVCFMHYLYNNHDHLIVYKNALDKADAQDKAVESSCSNDKKRKRRRKGQQTKFTNECNLQLNCMTRTEKNCPVVVTGENCLEYSVISNYMNMKSKVIKVDKKLAEQATGVRSKRRQGRGEGASFLSTFTNFDFVFI